jgi:hypothetical protein
MTKLIRKSFVAFLLALVISGCTNKESPKTTEEPSPTAQAQESINSDSPWETGQYPIKDYSPDCTKLSSGSFNCMFKYYVINNSKLPQEFEGDAFLVTDDGTVFQAFNSQYGNSRDTGYTQLNPGESVVRHPVFILPEGIVVKSIYKALSATSPHIYEVNFSNTWRITFS